VRHKTFRGLLFSSSALIAVCSSAATAVSQTVSACADLACEKNMQPEQVAANNTNASHAIETVIVTGRAADLVGIAASANQGQVSAADLAQRPILRPGEVVEEIPGVIITQHSGSGKANQYFLRGFNLDHGTDISVNLDDVPVNMPSHAHGQGYSDLNYLIPELVEQVDYKKGPYYADVGDFGSAGEINLQYYDTLPTGFIKAEGGQYGYGRLVAADSVQIGNGNLVYAGEFEHNNGPWDNPDDERKLDGVLRYTTGDAHEGLTVTAMAYHNIWNSTDQVPDRAIIGETDPAGAPTPPVTDLISRWGAIDPSDGGKTGRYSLDADWHLNIGNSSLHATAYGLYYNLALFSNFTYFLNDPIHGDQIGQKDNRFAFGGRLTDTWAHQLFSRHSETTVGLQLRNDDIHNGLYHTEDRAILGVTTLNDITETSISPYVENQTRWTPWLRTTLGLRSDIFLFNVDNLVGGNFGNASSAVLSPKVNIGLGPWYKTEFYLDFGQGFHSNDARGDISAIDSATPLPRSTGAEVGIRTTIIPGLRSEISLWMLNLQSELIWAGDEGDNEPSGPTQRYGVEFANWYTPTSWLTIDADYAWSRSYFTDAEADGDYIPEALSATFGGGIALHDMEGWAKNMVAGFRLRYFGPRKLTQDGSIQSRATTLLYGDLGYKLGNDWTVAFNVFNILNGRTSDIDYYYTSRLPGELLGGVDDIHTHPSEPREFRISITRTW
jgi:hypothetical protein